jgi:carbonic anhydrase/acetyltransferase-like protein (isoleucine patch superfamily)
MKKYELTSESKKTEHGKVYRIRALESFGDVKAGDYGGWVSGEHNLAQDGDCWVYDEAMVYGRASVDDNARVCDNARVYGKAYIYGNAQVYGNAHVYYKAQVWSNAVVSGNARIFGGAQVYGDAQVCSDACVFGDVRVFGEAGVSNGTHIYGDAWVFGDAQVFGKAWIRGHARISHANDLLTVGGLGSGYDWLTICKDAKTGVGVSSIGFSGSLDEFAARVREVHGKHARAQEYNALIELARVVFADALMNASYS